MKGSVRRDCSTGLTALRIDPATIQAWGTLTEHAGVPYSAAIMPSRPESAPASVLRARASRLTLLAGFTVVTALALFCATLLAVGFVLYAQIECHRTDIAAMLWRELGAPVELGTIPTGWHGWNPELVVQGFRVRD